MKTTKLLTLLCFIGILLSAQAQCPTDNTYLMDATPPASPGISTMTINCINGGQYVTVDVIAGNTYTFSTCGNTAFDTEITVMQGATFIGYNDDDCGVQSTVTWVATFTGTIEVLVDEFSCSNTGLCTDLVITSTPAVQSGTGCNTNTTICTPGVAGPFGFSTPGPAVSSCLDFFGPNYAYIVLYITASGPLEMLINGNATTGFLDVAIFDVTGQPDPCAATLNVANEISCNYALASSGCNEIGTNFGCASNVPSPMVTAGDVLFIVVENWSGTSTTFTLELGPPPAAQTGPPDGTVTAVADVCDTDPAFQMNAVDMGGTWTGTGVSASGIFDPAAAGIGSHVIDYTIGSVPCTSAGQTIVNVIACPTCNMTSLNALIGSCQSGSIFDVSGDFTYSGNPGTGTVIVEVTNASGTYTQTFNPPFVDGQIYNFNITGVPADGSPLTVTVYFSDDIACTLSVGSTSPVSCNCDADIGTFTVATQGTQVGNNITLCWNETIDITSNNDWTAPGEATAPPGPPYTPGVAWLVYSCPPTVALVPDPFNTVPSDPCFEFVLSGQDLIDFNDQWWLTQATLNGGSIPVNNTLYYVPITIYSTASVPMTYSYVNTSMPCYMTGPVYAVTYLDDVTETSVEDCVAGTVTTTITGGQPALDGSLFTGQNLVPATASFAPGTALSGGDIVVTGLVDGDAYSYDIVDANGCLITISGTFVGLEDPAFTYPSAAYCIDAANPSPTITGDAGGSFTSTAGLSINSVTGQINLAASTAGTYTVTYTTGDPVCFASTTFIITINPLPIVDGNDETICLGDPVTLNGTGADTYTWDLGVVDGVAFNPVATTVYTVTGTITATGCTNTGTATVTVSPLDIATFTTTDFCVGSASPPATVTGLAGGSFAFNPLPGDGATINAATGSVINGQSGATYTIEYTTNGPCPQTSTQPVTVNPLPTVVANDASICIGGNVNITASGAVTYSWDQGLGAGQTHNVSPVVNTNYTVTGTDANGCVNTDIMTVTVLANAPIDAGPDVTICAGDVTTLTATGGATYTWQAPISAAGAVQNVSPAATTIYTVDGVDAAGCTGTDQVTVTVNPLPAVNAGSDQTVCEGVLVTLNGSGAATYVWDNGVTDGVAFNPPVGATTTYAVIGTDANGCVNTDQVDVTVNPLPIVSAGVDQTVCEGVLVTLNGSGATGYVWDNGATNGVAFNPPVGATTTYTVTGTDGNGCVSTDQVDVTVNALPVVNAGLDQTVCDGILVTLSGAGAATYVWDNGVIDGAAFNQGVSTVVYTVIGTDANGCIDTDQVSVTVNPNPTPIINGAVTYCTGTFSTLSTSIPYTTYSWSTGPATPTVNVTDVDNPITVTVTNAFGCSGTSPVFTVTENNVITYNTTVEICQGGTAVIHGNVESVANVYSQTFILGTGCDSTSNVTLVVHALPVVDAGVDQTVCDGVATTLTAVGAPTLVWDNGITNGVPFNQGVGATVYTVTGTDVFGCVNTDQATITVNAIPVVDAGLDQTMCEGVQATLSGTGASGYVWTGGVVDGVPFNAPVGTTTTYTLTGTDVNGCVDTDQVDVTVNATPVVDAGPDQTMCEGLTATLAGSGAATYVWDNGVTNNVAFNAPIGTTTTYTVTGTDANGCIDTDQVDVTVNALPVVDAGVDQTMCAGVNVTLSGAGATAYVWDNGAINNVAFAAPAGTTTYTVTGTDANGCIDTDQVDVTVNALPIIVAGPDQTVCEGVQVTLSGAGGTVYVWDNGVVDGIAFNSAIGTVTYTVTGSDVNGCQNTDQVDVTVNPNPVVDAGVDFTVCDGDQAVLTASGALIYSWTGGITDGVGFIPTGTNNYVVTGTDANGCVDTDDVTVTVEPLPVISFIGDNLSGCASDPLVVNFTNTTPGALVDCIWTISNGTVLTGCGNVTATFNTPGTFDVTLTTTSANGCSNSETYVDYIYTEADPIASFIPSESVITNLNPEVSFENTSSGAVDYHWDFGDLIVSTEVSPSHTYPGDESASYLVELVAYSILGCTDTAYATIQLNEEVIFYIPNTFTPDDDDYNPTFQPVFTAGYDPFDFTLLIFNRWGEIIFESHNADIGWDGTYGGELVQDGTLTWKIEFKTTANDERKVVHGHVNILR